MTTRNLLISHQVAGVSCVDIGQMSSVFWVSQAEKWLQ
jgi:hypothetical protein